MLKEFIKKEISFEIISKYRTEWMGLAILQILLFHFIDGWMGYGEVFNTFNGWTYVICSFLNTRAFLFLSGFGLFYSLKKNFNLNQYYENRILRLFPAYILCSSAWYLYRDLIQNQDVVRFVSDLSLTSFWWWGNEWYLSVTLFLYLIFPFYFLCTRDISVNKHLLFLTIAVCVIFIINSILNSLAFNYYEMIKIGLGKIHYFFIGVFVANLSMKKMKCNSLLFLVCVILLYVSHVFLKHKFYMQLLPELVYDLMSELALFGALMVLCNYSNILKQVRFLTWMGKYSLEIYLIHMYMHKVFTRIFNCEYYLVLVLLCTILLPYPVHLLSGRISSSIINIIRKNN